MIIFILNGLMLSHVSAAKVSATYMDTLRKSYQLTCSENYMEVHELAKIAPQFTEFYESYFALTYSVNSSDEDTDRILSQPPPLEEDKPQGEKLNYALALLNSRSKDLDLIEKLINFHGQNPSYESHRLYIKSYLSGLRGNYQLALDTSVKMIEIAPILNSAMISGLFSLSRVDNGNEKILEESAQILKNKIKNAINPEFAQAAIDYVKSGADKYSKFHNELLESLYRHCPGDKTIAGLYASDLVSKKEYLNADPVLTKLIVGHKYSSPNNEFLFAVTRYHLGDYETAKQFFEKSADLQNIYINDQKKEIARRYLKALNRPVFLFRLIAIFSCTIVAFYIFRRKLQAKKRQAQLH